jgi:hypothetical protein
LKAWALPTRKTNEELKISTTTISHYQNPDLQQSINRVWKLLIPLNHAGNQDEDRRRTPSKKF